MAKKKDLLIVESPTKARTVSRLLGDRLMVLSSKGHIYDLPKSKLGVDVDHDFEPSYTQIRGKGEVVRTLKDAAGKAGVVYLGSDPDREGEAIAYFIARVIDGAAARRVQIHEITPNGLKKAFENAGEIDLNMVDSQKARRVLDRLVGYLASPLLWRTFANSSLSAGRVQSVALRLICEREREIQAFKAEEFWLVECEFRTSKGETFRARLMKCEGEDCRTPTGPDADAIKRQLESGLQFLVSQVKPAERRRSPAGPFITATLQQEAARRLRFTGRRTMSAAQQLFEGVSVGKEAVGLITYPRTDSFRVTSEMIDAARALIDQQFGKDYLPARPRTFKERKGTQGAHEAIRPTSLDRTPESVKPYLRPDQYELYDLIYRRFLASQMADALYKGTTVLVNAGDYLFQAEALKRLFPGFEKTYGDPEKEKYLPELQKGEEVFLNQVLPEQHFTQPPSRYSEAALIKKLEVNGIGRPSTYASIVSTLDDREYIRRREARIFPTELGLSVNDTLIPRFDHVFEVGFTREMEQELDRVEAGKAKWQEVVRRFYEPFKRDLTQAEKELEENCPKCGKPLVLKRGRHGAFLACSGYPQCDYIKRDAKEEKIMDEKCPQCGKSLVEREGRRGKFVGCSGFPQCRYIKPDAGSQAAPVAEGNCPQCGKPLAAKQGRYGPFIGCSGYPDCRYIQKKEKSPPTTLDEKCPECGKPLVERTGRYGKFVSCSGYPDCRYRPPKPSKAES